MILQKCQQCHGCVQLNFDVTTKVWYLSYGIIDKAGSFHNTEGGEKVTGGALHAGLMSLAWRNRKDAESRNSI